MGQSQSATDRKYALAEAGRYIDRENNHVLAVDSSAVPSDYLGYSTLSKFATGLGVVQHPIRELYLKYKKPGKGSNSPRRVLIRVVPGGLAVTLIDNRGATVGELFFDVNAVNYLELMRFHVVKSSEKKPRCMFLPLDESKMPANREKGSFPLDKAHLSVAHMAHPPLLACVLRRPRGLKALDCHVFVLESDADAVHIRAALLAMQGKASPTQMLAPSPSSSVPDNHAPDTNGFGRGLKGDVVRTEFGEFSIYRGPPKTSTYDPRGEPFPYNARREEQLDNHDRLQSRGSAFDPYRGYEPANGVPLPYSRQESEMSDPRSHSRRISSDSGENRFMDRSFSDSSDRSGSRFDMSLERPSSLLDARLSPRSSLRPERPPPPKVAEKPVSPISQGSKLSPVFPPSPAGTSSPRQPSTPRSPCFPPAGPAFSLSNLENRIDEEPSEEEPAPRPVGKVPPHLKSGVKVLPTGFKAHALKHHAPREEAAMQERREAMYSASDSSDSDMEAYPEDRPHPFPSHPHGRPGGYPGSHPAGDWSRQSTASSFGSQDAPRRLSGQEQGRAWSRESSALSGQPASDVTRRYSDQGRGRQDWSRDSSSATGFSSPELGRRPGHGQAAWEDRGPRGQEEVGPWEVYHFQDHSPPRPGLRGGAEPFCQRYGLMPGLGLDHDYTASSRRHIKSASAYELSGRSRDHSPSKTPDPHNKKKDEEIASMFSHMRLAGRESRSHNGFSYSSPMHSANFERSLGYFP